MSWQELGAQQCTVPSLELLCLDCVVANLAAFPLDLLSLLPRSIRYRVLLSLPAGETLRLEHPNSGSSDGVGPKRPSSSTATGGEGGETKEAEKAVTDVAQAVGKSFADGVDKERLWSEVLSCRLSWVRTKTASPWPAAGYGRAWDDRLAMLLSSCPPPRVASKDKYFSIVWASLSEVIRPSGKGTTTIESSIFEWLFCKAPSLLRPSTDHWYYLSPLPFCKLKSVSQFDLIQFLSYLTETCHYFPGYARLGCTDWLSDAFQCSQEFVLVFSKFMSRLKVLQLCTVEHLGLVKLTREGELWLGLHKCLAELPFLLMKMLASNECLPSSLLVESSNPDEAVCILQSIGRLSAAVSSLSSFSLVPSRAHVGGARRLQTKPSDNRALLKEVAVLLSSSRLRVLAIETDVGMIRTRLLDESVFRSREHEAFLSGLVALVQQPQFCWMKLCLPLPVSAALRLVAAFLSSPCSHRQCLEVEYIVKLLDASPLAKGTPKQSPTLEETPKVVCPPPTLKSPLGEQTRLQNFKSLELDLSSSEEVSEWLFAQLNCKLYHLHLRCHLPQLVVLTRGHFLPSCELESLSLKVNNSQWYKGGVDFAPVFTRFFSLPTLKSFRLKGWPSSQVQGSFLASIVPGLLEQANIGALVDLQLSSFNISNEDDSTIKLFFDALFSLPQVGRLELMLTCWEMTPHTVGIILSSFQKCRGQLLCSLKLVHTCHPQCVCVELSLSLSLLEQLCCKLCLKRIRC